jgi:hypothetical protein
VNFSEQPGSRQWAALLYQGRKIAEVWFKPEGQPFALTFRVLRNSVQTPGVGQRVTIENLLKAVGIATEEVESWHHEGVSHSGMNDSNLELRQLLPTPAPDVAYLEIYVSLRPPQVVGPKESGVPEVPSTKEQDLEARWNAILGLEASIDGLRITMEGVRVELEAAWKKPLSLEERMHALRADVHQWNKAKARVPYALPKVKEFVHRATWVLGAPERKKLGALFKDHIERDIPLPEMDRLADELASLLKDRQILSGQGVSVHQECKNIAAEIQGALRRLQSNAATNARRNRNASGTGGKFFTDQISANERRYAGAGLEPGGGRSACFDRTACGHSVPRDAADSACASFQPVSFGT